jgi:hypothetical protein
LALPSREERIADNRARTFADSVMYREALATAAHAAGPCIGTTVGACFATLLVKAQMKVRSELHLAA